MLSKPKTGLYIKNRDQRRSPRNSDEQENHLLDLEVEVENFGEGMIKANQEPEWPQRNFEGDETDAPVTDEHKLSSQAKKYLVNSNSLKELTGAKFITVPESKTSQSDQSSRPQSTGSVRLYNHGGLTGRQYRSPTVSSYPLSSQENPNYQPPQLSYVGDVRRLSARHVASRGGNMPLRSFRVKAGKSNTLRLVSTSSSSKGYHLGSNLTIRSHNTGHTVQQILQHKLPGWDNPIGTVAFHRANTMDAKKEYNFTTFQIELDKQDGEVYYPGDTMSGRIIIEVDRKVEIRFVELLIVGVASAEFSKTDPNNPTSARQVIFSKRSYVMGTPDGRWNSVITPGKYVSRFRFVLPEGIPSTLKYTDQKNGFSFEVGYMVKCRICDEVGASSARSTHSTNNFVKVLLTRRNPFNVRRLFDISAIPNALMPLQHSDVVNIGCLPTSGDASNVTLSLDRSVFRAGDEIHLRLITSYKTSRKIQSLRCELHQRLKTTIKPAASYTVAQIFRKNPEGSVAKHNKHSTVVYEFVLPTRSNFIPSFMAGCSILSVTYSVTMDIYFKTCNGTLVLDVPIGLAPCGALHQPDMTGTVPMFNRPKRFPNFSRPSDGEIPKMPNGNAPQSHLVERQGEPESVTIHL